MIDKDDEEEREKELRAQLKLPKLSFHRRVCHTYPEAGSNVLKTKRETCHSAF